MIDAIVHGAGFALGVSLVLFFWIFAVIAAIALSTTKNVRQGDVCERRGHHTYHPSDTGPVRRCLLCKDIDPPNDPPPIEV